MQGEILPSYSKGIDSTESNGGNQTDQGDAGQAKRSPGSGQNSAPQHSAGLGRVQVCTAPLPGLDTVMYNLKCSSFASLSQMQRGWLGLLW